MCQGWQWGKSLLDTKRTALILLSFGEKEPQECTVLDWIQWRCPQVRRGGGWPFKASKICMGIFPYVFFSLSYINIWKTHRVLCICLALLNKGFSGWRRGDSVLQSHHTLDGNSYLLTVSSWAYNFVNEWWKVSRSPPLEGVSDGNKHCTGRNGAKCLDIDSHQKYHRQPGVCAHTHVHKHTKVCP